MAHPNHSNVTLRFKLVYTTFQIYIENFDINRNCLNAINEIKTHVAREMGLHNVRIILAGQGENSYNRDIEHALLIHNPNVSFQQVIYNIDTQIVELHVGSYHDTISFYISPIDNNLRHYLRNNAPNDNVYSLHGVMYIIHQLNTTYEGACADTDDDNQAAAAEAPLSPPSAPDSPTTVTMDVDDTTSNTFQGECCVCYRETELSHHYNCLLGQDVNHGLCDTCWNRWRSRNDTCPVCRAEPGTPGPIVQLNLRPDPPPPPPPQFVDNNNNEIYYNNIPDNIMAYIANRPQIHIENNTITISNVNYNTIHNLENRINILNSNNDNNIIHNNINYIHNAIHNIINSAYTPYDNRNQT